MAGRSRRSLVVVFFVILTCGFLGVVFGRTGAGAPATTDANVDESLRNFSQVYSIVEQNYAEKLDADKAIYDGAIPGMLRVLDPHSNFFDPKQYSGLQEEQRGRYYGVGMQVGPRNNRVIVIAPFAGAPAYRAGIRPGDIIVGVDGKNTENMTTSEVADLLKGPKGTTVRISILRDGNNKPVEFAVVRDEIPRYSVDVHFVIRPGIGYLHINNFQETTEQETAEALEQMGDLKGLILDLRNNPGGLLNEGVGVADKFLKKGQVIVSHHGRNSPEKVYRAAHGSTKDYPIVVLVNHGTASAAEIVSGAIQDHDRGLIAGENTFGKGLVQTVYRLSENTGLALTTAKYYTPSGRLIQRDYTGVSLYDYYYNRNQDDYAINGVKEDANREVKLTDSGRTVYGGGGITPDVKIAAIKANKFQEDLLRKYAFFNFAKKYAQTHKIGRDFVVDDAVMKEFRALLAESKLTYDEKDMTANLEWVRAAIKSELFVGAFGQQEGMRVQAETDPTVLKALDLMPKAKELTENARRTIAEHNQARLTAPKN
ncbi:MAG: S41 family peptidase [Acidobacteriota bacterium]|nr:S41 family peptidase [Acidobacteriota bacterium]